MPSLNRRFCRLPRALALALLTGAAGALLPVPAYAHFFLESPTNWVVLAPDGTPQKTGPCGNEGGTATGVVTTYSSNADGTTNISITLHETVFHPGHYRVAIAADQTSLPPDPVVTPSGGDACAMAAVETNATLPILNDNRLVHTAPFSQPQTVDVTVPAGFTCTPTCTLQVIEFMSSHPAPCFYHHCADISISPRDAGADAASDARVDAASNVESDASPTTSKGGGAGCAVSAGGGAAASAVPARLVAANRDGAPAATRLEVLSNRRSPLARAVRQST